MQSSESCSSTVYALHKAYIYNSYLFWSNYKCRALVTRKQKNKLKLNIKLNNAYFKLQLCE